MEKQKEPHHEEEVRTWFTSLIQQTIQAEMEDFLGCLPRTADPLRTKPQTAART